MKKTSYEMSKQLFGPTMAAARDLVAKSPSAEQLMVDLFNEALQTRVLDHGGLLAAVPYALAEKAATLAKDPFNWEEVSQTEPMQVVAHFDLELGQAAHRPDERMNQSWVSASCINLYQFQCHRLAGERVYELSLGLGERLLSTELHGINSEDLKLPYPSIYIVIPPELGLKLVNERTGIHALEGIYVTEYEHEGLRRWKLLFWGSTNENSTHEYDDTLFHFTVSLPAGKSLEQALDISESRTFNSPRATPISEQYYFEKWRPLFKLVMNIVVYCTWPDAELRTVQNPEWTKLQEQMKKHPKGSHKYERTRDRLRETLQQRRVVLGPSTPRFEAPGVGNPLLVRVKVSGHWKRQVHGEGRALRKWIFIQPFWRGPDDAPESNPRRVLDAP